MCCWFMRLTEFSKRISTISSEFSNLLRELAFLMLHKVEGIDISPTKDTWYVSFAKRCFYSLILSRWPDNCHVHMDDIRSSEWWGLANGYTYDYIHTRMSLGIFQDFREVIQKGYNNLEPGGWMESQELYPTVYCDDGTMPDNWPLKQWSEFQDEAAHDILGTPLRIANKLQRWYEQAGLVEVQEEIFKIPIHEWAQDPRLKMLGKCMAWNMEKGLYGWSVNYFHRAFGWTQSETQVRLAEVFNCLSDKTVHAYYKV